jgi:hypothetical protein
MLILYSAYQPRTSRELRKRLRISGIGAALNDRTYVVVGFGEAPSPLWVWAPGLPKISIFLVVVAGKAGNYHQKRMILGGLAALQSSRRGRPRKSC